MIYNIQYIAYLILPSYINFRNLLHKATISIIDFCGTNFLFYEWAEFFSEYKLFSKLWKKLLLNVQSKAM